MNIGLVSLSGVRVRTRELAELGVTLPGFVRRGRVIASLPSLGLLTVAALTPPGHRVSYVEYDALPPFSDLPDFDLVGISALTARIGSAYQLAAAYRARGARVVLGGLHASALPDEALDHVDSVVTGGAEGIWPCVVSDAASGRLQRMYCGATSGVFSPSLYARPRFDLLDGRSYNRITIQTSRGCPRACEFCGASLRITSGFQQKPVERVIDELHEARRWFPEPFVEFADDNTFLDRRWSRDFLTALEREEIHWFTETDASVADDPTLCDRLAKAGCRQLLIGFESPQADALRDVDPAGWKSRQAPRIRRVVDTLQGRGISVNGCFIVGLDHHTPDIFPTLHEFVRESGLAEVQYTVLTPFPGTPLRARLQREGRLLPGCGWERCTLFDVGFIPRRMSVGELEEGLRWLFRETYSSSSVRQRTRSFVRSRHRGSE